MPIISFRFLGFLAAVLLLYYGVPKRFQWHVLLTVSIAFYCFSGLSNLLFLAFSIVTYYFGAQVVHKQLLSGKPNKKTNARWLLALVLVLNIGWLTVFKLSDAGIRWIQPFAQDLGFPMASGSLLLPLGISFYTFQATGYLIDVYRQKIKPEPNPAKFALFISFFPQLVQGPISRFDQLMHQLTAQRKFDFGRLVSGGELMLYGCFKKLVIANNIAPYTGMVFANTAAYPGAYVVLAAVLGLLQLYCDFSGGIDIVRGAAEMLGITLPDNFRRPFFSRSIAEYWRRWHITLNEWWREYLFFPIALSRPMNRFSKLVRRHLGSEAGKYITIYVGIFVVRMVNALWHGIGFRTVASGLYYSVIMIAALMMRKPFAKMIERLNINTESFGFHLMQMARTFVLLCVNRVFFMSAGLWYALYAFRDMISVFNPQIFWNGALAAALPPFQGAVIVLGLGAVLAVSILQERGVPVRERFALLPLALRWLVLFTAVFAILLLGNYGSAFDASQFIYARF